MPFFFLYLKSFALSHASNVRIRKSPGNLSFMLIIPKNVIVYSDQLSVQVNFYCVECSVQCACVSLSLFSLPSYFLNNVW